MTLASPPTDDPALVGLVRATVPGLRAALLFGSCLSPATRRPTSIPDVMAFVDDLDGVLVAFGLGPFRRRLGRALPPVTLALGADGVTGPTIAKLTLTTPALAADTIARLPDLSLCGRLAKQTRLLHARDAETRAEVARLLDAATEALARTTLLGLPRRLTLDLASRRCFALSYRAELRPESPSQIAARYDAFAAEHRARYQPLLCAAAAVAGITVADGVLCDQRPSALRRLEARALSRLLTRARWRSALRFARQTLLYRGWAPYLLGKLARAWARPPPAHRG